ncbi:BMP family lipoprotein [Gottfriedia solisilvae]|uniref:BMP family lipoprotein n=1 Tax=Gottfriedia solisilvae TaxID=1516104 RepID=UPI003530A5FF
MSKERFILNIKIKKWTSGIALMIVAVLLLCSCSTKQVETDSKKRLKVGIMLSSVGLGDQSFSDAAFSGLIKAREESDIFFDYREPSDDLSFEQGFTELVKEDCELVVGLGFSVKESLEKVAKQYPNQKFLLIDETSELPNVTSLTFKEEEGSFLVGAIAGLTTKTNVVGFIGGEDVPLIKKFEKGFAEGVKATNPKASVMTEYAGDFGKADLGAEIAGDMIKQKNVDTLYAAAGFTGVGVLQEAQKNSKYAIGVDTDQFFIAEKAVVTSMLKNVDVAIQSAIKSYIDENGKFPEKNMTFGLKEDGVGSAPIRVITLDPEKEKIFEDLKQKLANGEITIPLD